MDDLHLSPRFSNTAGPCRPGRHALLPASARLPDAMRLIDEGRHFALPAARRTGKSTAVRATPAKPTPTPQSSGFATGRTPESLRHLDTLGMDKGWLLIVDLHSALSWDERLYRPEIERDGKTIHLCGG